jgi:hypothetical protein
MRNIAYAAKEIDVRIALAEKLHRPPFPTDPPLNFRVHIFNSKKRGCGMTLPTQEVGDTFLRTYGHTSIMVKGHKIMFRLSDKPVNEGRVRHVRSTPWEDPHALEERNKQNQSSRVDNGWIFVPRIACHDNSRMIRCLLCSLFSCKRVLPMIGINKICPSKVCAQSVRGISNGNF